MTSLPSFQIVKYTDDQIIMKNINTKQLYLYLGFYLPDFQPISHPNIQTPTVFENGILYPLPLTTLAKQIANLSQNPTYSVPEDEIINTFIPVIQVLRVIHGNGKAHGSLSPQSIVFNEEGDIQILYPSPKEYSKPYYPSEKPINKLDDFQALAKIILELFKTAKEQNTATYNSNLERIQTLAKTNQFSASFLCAMLIMLDKIESHIDQLEEILTNHEYIRLEKNTKLKRLYETILRQNVGQNKKTETQAQKNKRIIIKQQFTPPLLKHSQQLQSPKNRFQGLNKKLLRAQQNTENKKTFEETKKKEQKGQETVLKNMRNAKLMVEGQNNYENLYNKILRDIRETKQREELLKITAKRVRTKSKKKVNT